MMQLKQRPTIQTVTGRYFHLTDPQQNVFEIEAIAHALSHICRFTGHTRQFYSVAQHAVLCSYVKPEEGDAFAKLMHDCSEAFLGDVSSPLKQLLPEYKRIEKAIEAAIFQHYDLPTVSSNDPADAVFGGNVVRIGRLPDLPFTVKLADLAMLATEKRDLMPVNTEKEALADAEEWRWLTASDIQPLARRIWPWGHKRAKQAFLARFYELCPDRFLTMERRKHVQRHRLASNPVWGFMFRIAMALSLF